MPTFFWNPQIKYRSFHDRHLLIDISQSNRVIEISPLLARLFAAASTSSFDVALTLWRADAAAAHTSIDDATLLALLDTLVRKGLLNQHEH